MKKTRVLLALITVAAISMSIAPGGAAIRKKTLGVRTYEVSGSVLQTENADPTCNLSRAPVSNEDFPHPSDVAPDGVPADQVPAYPKTPRDVPEPAGSALPRGCQVTADGSIDQGGLVFPKIGGSTRSAWVKIFIKDEFTGTPVFYLLCQDFDGDDTCGEGAGDDPTNPNQVEETSSRGCSPGAPMTKVNTRYPVVIFVVAGSTGCRYIDDAEDTYAATRGTVKLVRYFR